MKRQSFIVTFISMHVLFIFLHIHKYMQSVQQSYRKQKNEQRLALLVQRKQLLTNTLHAYKNPQMIKQYAQNNGFTPARLPQLKRVAL